MISVATDDEPVTSGEAARILNVCLATVRHYEMSGDLMPTRRTSAGWRLFRRRDVERLAAQRAQALVDKRARLMSGGGA